MRLSIDALRLALSYSGVLRLAMRLLVGVCAVHFWHVSRLGIGMALSRFTLLHLALGVLLHTCSCKLLWWVLGALYLFIDALAECVALSAFTRRFASWYTSDWLYSRGGRLAFRASRLVVDALHRVLLRSESCLWLCPFSSKVTQCTFSACRTLVLRCWHDALRFVLSHRALSVLVHACSVELAW